MGFKGNKNSFGIKKTLWVNVFNKKKRTQWPILPVGCNDIYIEIYYTTVYVCTRIQQVCILL